MAALIFVCRNPSTAGTVTFTVEGAGGKQSRVPYRKRKYPSAESLKELLPKSVEQKPSSSYSSSAKIPSSSAKRRRVTSESNINTVRESVSSEIFILFEFLSDYVIRFINELITFYVY